MASLRGLNNVIKVTSHLETAVPPLVLLNPVGNALVRQAFALGFAATDWWVDLSNVTI
jgi:hypothetical protein